MSPPDSNMHEASSRVRAGKRTQDLMSPNVRYLVPHEDKIDSTIVRASEERQAREVVDPVTETRNQAVSPSEQRLRLISQRAMPR